MEERLVTAKKTNTVTVSRSAKTGQYVVRKSGGAETTYKVQPKSSDAIGKSLSKNRDALQRLANR
jgi:hypothetical protein